MGEAREAVIRLGYVRASMPFINAACLEKGRRSACRDRDLGTQGELWATFARFVGARLELHRLASYGACSKDGRCSGLTGAVVNGSLDATLARLSIRQDRLEHGAFGPGMETVQNGFLIPHHLLREGASAGSDVLASLAKVQIFGWPTVGAMLGAAVAIALFARSVGVAGVSVWSVLIGFTKMSQSEGRLRALPRAFRAAFLIATAFTVALYDAAFTGAHMSKPVLVTPFSRTSELAALLEREGFSLLVSNGEVLDTLSARTGVHFSPASRRRVHVQGRNEAMAQALCRPGSKVVGLNSVGRQNSFGVNAEKQMPCRFERIPIRQLPPYRLAFFCRPGWRLAKRFEDFQLRLYSREQFERLQFRRYFYRPIRPSVEGEIFGAYQPLNPADINLVLSIFVCGLISGLCYFVAELSMSFLSRSDAISVRIAKSCRKSSLASWIFSKRGENGSGDVWAYFVRVA